MEIFVLSLIAFCTSTMAGVIGQGGGLVLMPVLAGAVPPALLIPVHGFIQAASNGSRALFAYRSVRWMYIKPVFVGALIGASIMLPIIQNINWEWMQTFIGFFILYLTWGRSLKLPGKLPAPFVTLGFFQGSLGMLVGATGPLGSALLLRKNLSKEEIVATNAMIMLISHLLKIVLYTAIGFAFFSEYQLLIWMTLASILGSYFGTHLRLRINEIVFFRIFKVVITLLAVRMVLLPLL